jgi:1-deoxy-D-xylulose-5-phosphate reductoisomerase
MNKRRRIALLGSTGSIGRQTLEVVRWMPERFEIAGLAAGGYSELFRSQLEEFHPRLAAVGRASESDRTMLPPGMLWGQQGLTAVAGAPEVDLVVVAIVGRAGLAPALEAVGAGKDVALANKEALVMAGNLVTEVARRSGARILPIDSEHSAIWQCLRGEGELDDWLATVRSVILTASGGALRDVAPENLKRVTPAQVLAHPTWKMGPKVTVDSATLMNKGLEVIEARWLFGLPLDRVKMLLHRESVVHSMVEFVDGSVKAQLGAADMRIPIQHALCYPERVPGPTERLSLAKTGSLSFGEIDLARYPCLRLALDAARHGLSYPAAMSGANEVAVDLFLNGNIAFTDISELVEEVLSSHRPVEADSLEAILHVDEWARSECLDLVQRRRRY